MLDVGRLCIKTAGKDAGKAVVIVDTIDKNFVLIDGPIKRKRCNMQHLEPTKKVLKLKKNASHAEVVKEFKKELKIEIQPTKTKTKKSPKPTQQRTIKQKPVKKKKLEKKEAKKEQPKKEKTTKEAKKK